MVDHALEKIVLNLYRDGDWKEIIKLKDTEDNFEKHRILWIWPSLDDLNWFKVVINDRNISGIVSIGCGSGLLEWLMQKHLGITIIGVEVDRQWWLSNYSPPLFLKNVRFVDEEDNDFEIQPCQALLFCYFNNRPAFRDYMEQYHGSTVIVIGPGEGRGTCTDPTPFDNQFVELGWKLQASREIGSTKDYITVYVNQTSKPDFCLPWLNAVVRSTCSMRGIRYVSEGDRKQRDVEHKLHSDLYEQY